MSWAFLGWGCVGCIIPKTVIGLGRNGEMSKNNTDVSQMLYILSE